MSWDILPKNILQYFLTKLKDKLDALSTAIGNKVSKSGDTMTGDLGLPSARSSIDGSAPFSGAISDSSILTTDLSDYKSIIGSAVFSDANSWNNVINVRHRNGKSDGNEYGMYIRSRLTAESSLFWRQHISGTWKNERTIWDNVNLTKLSQLSNDSGFLSGTVPIGNGGTGATTRLNALKNLTNENVGTSSQYFLTITDSWGKGGYCSVANAKTVLGLGSAAYYNCDTSATANTIVRRQGNGYVYAVYYNSSNGAENINSYSGALPMFADTNGWLRKTSIANMKTALGVPRKAYGKYVQCTYYNDSELHGSFTVDNANDVAVASPSDGRGLTTMSYYQCYKYSGTTWVIVVYGNYSLPVTRAANFNVVVAPA